LRHGAAVRQPAGFGSEWDTFSIIRGGQGPYRVVEPMMTLMMMMMTTTTTMMMMMIVY
jgi:hypothetical protein